METLRQFTFEEINNILGRIALENEEYKKESLAVKKELREAARQMKATDKVLKKMSEKVDKLSDLYNGFAKNTGEAVEQFFFDYFERNLKMGDVVFEKAKHHMEGSDSEYDIVLSNGKYVGIIECKHKFHPKDFEKFVFENLPKFKTEFAKFQNCKIVAGIATYVLVEDVKQLALEHGLYIYTQHAEKVKLQNTKNFKVKYY